MERVGRESDLEHKPLGSIDKVLDWIDQLRDMSGEPRVDDRPWKGNDFRL